MLPSRGRRAALVVVCLLFVGGAVHAQSGTFFNQRDDQYTLLGLKRAKEAFDAAKAEFERFESLAANGTIAAQEFERIRSNYKDAEVNYQQSLLAVIFEQQYVTISRAVKYKDQASREQVQLTIENAAGAGAEFAQLVEVEDELFRSLQPDIIHDVYVSLMNDEGAIIGLPYEAKIEELRFGRPQNMTFTLLQDLDAVSVNIIYGRGSERRLKVFLQKDASVNKAAVEAVQFSQEVELGSTTDFAMTLELFSGEQNTFKLDVVNLPPEINRYFVDPATDNRLSQFQFTEGVNARQASLRIFLPERPTENVQMDEPISFYALAIPRDRAQAIGDLRGRTMTEEQIRLMNVGFVKLELVPRGVGEILVRAPQLFFTINPDESVEVNIEVENEGTRVLNNVRVEAEPPLNWDDDITPSVIEMLDINEEQQVTLRFTPPPGISPGRYEVRVETTSLSDDQPIRGEDKTIQIEIEQEANVLGMGLLLILIVGLVAGIVIFGIRLSRR